MRWLTTALSFWLLTDAAAAALTLDEALQRARAANPTLLAQRQQLQEATAQLRALNSGYWPTLEGRAGYTLQVEPQAIVAAGRAQPTQDRRYPFWSVGAEQVLYDFGRTAGRAGRGEAQVAEATALLGAGEQEVALAVVSAYCRILSCQHLLAAAQEEVAQMEDHRRIAAVLLEQGVVTRNDLLQAEVRLAASRQSLLARGNELDNAWLQLNYLLARGGEERDELVPPAPVDEVPLDPLARPELAAARARVTVATAERLEARARFWPQIFLRGEVNYLDNSYAREQTIYALTGGLRVNLFDGFASAAQIAAATAREFEASARQRELASRVVLEEGTARNDLHAAQARLQVLEAAVLAGEENLRLNRERYRLQTGTASEVLDAQTLLTQTRSDYWRAYFDIQVAWARVRRATGHL